MKRMIDISNGSVFIAEKDTLLEFNLCENVFVESMLFSDVLEKDINVYINYFIKPQKIYNKQFMMRLYFNQMKCLEFLQLFISTDDEIPSWDNWSKEKEINKKAEHDKWLQENLGNPPYKYSWGEITSKYDMRSGSSSITIRYAKT